MQIIEQSIHAHKDKAEVIQLFVERHTLARKRWRGVASDGIEFGFDLKSSLKHGDVFFEKEGKLYAIEQTEEPCFLIQLDAPKVSAWLGWMVGNLHFKAEFTEEGMLVQDDLAVRQMLERESIDFALVNRIFQPCTQGGHSHDQPHSHSHAH
ncbi:MAG: urease accessory protein UreE [Coraliomargaritaceae bacterium]